MTALLPALAVGLALLAGCAITPARKSSVTGPGKSGAEAADYSSESVIKARTESHAHYAVVFEHSEEQCEAVPFLHVGKTARVGVDTRIGGKQDIPPVIDEELQKLNLGKRA